jgi:hypothetical protein
MTRLYAFPLIELASAVMAQVEIPEQPQNLTNLLWVISALLFMAVIKLYRDREKDRQEMIDRVYVIAENSTEAMNTMAAALEDINEGLDLTGQIRDIQDELREIRGKDG